MTDLKKFILVCFSTLFIVFNLVLFVSADTTKPTLEQNNNLQGQIDASGAKSLTNDLPDDTKDILNDLNLSELSISEILKLNPKSFFNAIINMAKNTAKTPFITMTTVLGVLILTSLIKGLKTGGNDDSVSNVFSLVSTATIAVIIAKPLIDCIADASSAIKELGLFLFSFIPVFTGVMATSGKVISASGYSLFMIAAAQVITAISVNFLIPIMSIYFVFAMASSLFPAVNLNSLASGLKTCVSWALGLIVTIFMATLSFQGIISQSADSVAVRATKFVVGGFIPVVGGAISEALTSIQGCLGLLKNTVGIFGIIIGISIVLPILIGTLVWLLVSNILCIASGFFGNEQIASFFKAISGMLSILLAIIFSVMVIITFSTGIFIVIGF